MGFTKYDEFGSEEIPENFLVSFTDSVPAIVLRDLLLELIPLGAGYINLVRKEEARYGNYGNTIFIGSYLYEDIENVIIDQKVLNILHSLDENSKASDLVKK